MKLSASFLRRLHWLNLPGALLVALLQRTPVLRVATTAGEIIHASPIGSVLRSAVAAAASLGALHTLAGATTLSVSSGAPSGASGTVGAQFGPIAMGTIGTASQPLSWQISGTIPAGLRFLSSSGTSLTTAGTLNTPSGVMLLTGTPTAPAGTYTVTLIAFEGANRTLTSSPTYAYAITLTGGGASAAPAITGQPASRTVNIGETATFTVAVTGTPTPTIQWRKDGTNLPGETAATLTLTNVQSSSSGSYTAVATNSVASATSAVATLTVNNPSAAAAITTQPVSQVSAVGLSVTFTVGATGTPAPTYQWLKNSTPIVGATGASLVLSNLTFADAANYVVNVTNSFGTVVSAAASLTVNATLDRPAITAQPPASLNLIAGQSLALNVVASGAGLSYQWRRTSLGGTVGITGATSAAFTIKPLTTGDAGTYSCEVTNAQGSTISTASIVAVTASSANPGRLINLSVLTSIATALEDFSLGYVVSGATGTNVKPLVIRAVGPSLGALGVPGTLPDPKMELFAGATKTAENDDWGGAQTITNAMSAVGAFAYSGGNSRDAALAANIVSRDNSVKIFAGASAPNATGAVIGEVYDATPSASFNATTTPRLINLSVRKNVGTVLTMGFVIGGSTGKSMLVRAIGPTLGTFGVPGVLVDPKIELFDNDGKTVAANDNWGGTAALASAFTDTGAFVLPSASRDAALLVTLAPGNYTAQVTVATGTTGVALVEVYEAP